jgi:hypothetical protein
MPLAFESLSHGTVAFGFFNIETDLILLEHYFFFADDFCKYLEDIAQNSAKPSYRASWQIQYIESPENIGDLHAAIQRVRYSGFIGELYRRFPFPLRAEDFKQNPDGNHNHLQVEEILQAYAKALEITINVAPDGEVIEIGSYRFSRSSFLELIQYVWRGGYPRWRDEIRPDYVVSMKNTLMRDSRGLFEGIVFDV